MTAYYRRCRIALMKMQASLRVATVDDLARIVGLERDCSTAAHWSHQQYLDALAGGKNTVRLMLVAEGAPEIVKASLGERLIAGFIVANHVDVDWELENIVVAPEVRRTGLGKRLLEGLLAEVCTQDGASVFLEVRESNTPARTLYEKVGFRQTGRRKAYYSNPQEDAILYTWNAAQRDTP